MRLSKTLGTLLLLACSGCVFAQQEPLTVRKGKVQLDFQLDEKGAPRYAVSYDGKTIVQPSSMGFVLNNAENFYDDFTLLKQATNSVHENWTPVWGEVKSIQNDYTTLELQLQQAHGNKRLLHIVFKVYEDGVGFRYEFPEQPNLDYFTVQQEKTGFQLTGNHKAFWIPGDYDTNEYPYTTSLLSEIDNAQLVEKSTDIAVRVAPDKHAVQTPLMLKTSDGLYINIHEAALLNYPAMQLHVNNATYDLTANLVPSAVGTAAFLHAPAVTPWRTIIVSNKATDILSSKLILNLNEPSKLSNTSWIKPMKFVGVWWELQTGKSSWSYAASAKAKDAQGKLIPSGQHGGNNENVKRYIDFAAQHGIEGVLIEGWNTGWEDWFGNWKEDVFDFVTPYPDFDVKALNAYAKSKGVQLVMHNETSGSATNYERQLDTAYRFMRENGYNAVKTGYVGKIIPRGEHHDGQWMVNHYTRVAEKAAEYQVMVDAHEQVRPTGLHRTYPNWMTGEASRGNEYNAFSIGNAPEHETILPFTRLMGGPMDYTPGIFKLSHYNAADTAKRVRTTLVKQMALYVTMYSPIQMVSDLPENYEAHLDAFQFIKDVPVDWDDTKVLAAEPGDYVSIVRKGKGTENWYLGAITDEQARDLKTGLDFLPPGVKYVATLYADVLNQPDPAKYSIKKYIVDRTTAITLKLANSGGAAISFVPATAAEAKQLPKYK